MKKLIFIFSALIFLSLDSYGQHFLGVKGGIGLNMQRWNSFERDILFSPFVDVFAESHDDEINKLYASLGIHTRGSTVRGFGFNTFNPYKFNNIVLEVGGKRMITVDRKYNGYYMLGLRGEYTISTNLNARPVFSVFNLVDDFYVNRFVYGVSLGGGFEMKISDTQIVFIEASVNPDLSKQYDQPETLTIENPNQTPSPFPQSQFITIVPQEVRNVSLEIKVGIKFLRNYYYEDEEY